MCGIVCAIAIFSFLDLTAPGAAPIIKLLREIPSALRFVLEHPLDHMKAVGMTTASFCTVSPVGYLHSLAQTDGNTQQLMVCCLPLQMLTALVFGMSNGNAHFSASLSVI